MIHSLARVITLLACCVLIAPVALAADSTKGKSTSSAAAKKKDMKVVVGHPSSYERSYVRLEMGETANLVVYLASAGEMVNGFRVSLVQTKSHKLLKTLISNEHGIVKFSGLQPGDYTVALRMSKRLRNTSSVHIGDLVLGID